MNASQLTLIREAKRILEDWYTEQNYFVKVMPTDYKKALEKVAFDLSTKFDEVINS